MEHIRAFDNGFDQPNISVLLFYGFLISDRNSPKYFQKTSQKVHRNEMKRSLSTQSKTQFDCISAIDRSLFEIHNFTGKFCSKIRFGNMKKALPLAFFNY